MSIRHATAATVEEQAELRELRDRADRTTAEAAQTLAELTGRLAKARQPAAVARLMAADARNAAARALREGPGRLAGQRGAKRAALAAIPVLAIAAAVVVAHQHGYVPAWSAVAGPRHVPRRQLARRQLPWAK